MKPQSSYFPFILVIISHNIFITGFIYANEKNLHPIETNLLRGLVTFFINFCLLKYYKMDMEFKIRGNHKYLLIRSGSICLHSLTLAICGFYLPQPVIHTINCTGPIFVIIEDYFINGTRINSKQLKGIVLTFLGIILTINGQNMMKLWFDQLELNSNTNFKNYASVSSIQKMIMGILFAFMAVVWAYGTVIIKNIQGLHSLHINLHFGIFTTIVNALIYPIFVTQPTETQTIFKGFFLCGAPMAIGNILYIHALNSNKNTGLLTICISSGVVVGYLISVLRYNEQINYFCLIGSFCIVSGLYITLTAKSDQKQKQDQLLDQTQQTIDERTIGLQQIKDKYIRE